MSPVSTPLTIPSAEPFFLPGSRTGCLLVHGFTGTPKEMRGLGEYLHQQGFTVAGVRLFGHATQPADMVRSRWRDWVASVEDGLNLLKPSTEHMIVIGLSMGGVLAMYTAAHYEVTGAVALSAPVDLKKDWRLKFIKPLSKIIPDIKKDPDGWHNPENRHGHVSYPAYPTRSIAELHTLLQHMQAGLPAVTCPVLLIQSHGDTSILPHSMDTIYERLGSQDKQKIWIENSGHIITKEAKETVYPAVARFVQRVAGDK